MFSPVELTKLKSLLTKYQLGDDESGMAMIHMREFRTIVGRECIKYIPQHEPQELTQLCDTILLNIFKTFKLPDDSNGGHILSYINKYLGPKLKEKVKALESKEIEISLQTPISDEDDSTLEDVLADISSLNMEDRIAFRIDLERAISKFPPKQQKMINMSFDGYTHEEIAKALGTSRPYITQTLQSCIEKLRIALADYNE